MWRRRGLTCPARLPPLETDGIRLSGFSSHIGETLLTHFIVNRGQTGFHPVIYERFTVFLNTQALIFTDPHWGRLVFLISLWHLSYSISEYFFILMNVNQKQMKQFCLKRLYSWWSDLLSPAASNWEAGQGYSVPTVPQLLRWGCGLWTSSLLIGKKGCHRKVDSDRFGPLYCLLNCSGSNMVASVNGDKLTWVGRNEN